MYIAHKVVSTAKSDTQLHGGALIICFDKASLFSSEEGGESGVVAVL
jgi:hypothetical protein